MTTAVMGTPYCPPSPPGHSPDTTSPIYPDRPIRPLPKRPLRSRLSPELADTIRYPPAPPVSRPLFYHPYNDPTYFANGIVNSPEVAEIDKALVEAQSINSGNPKNGYQFKGNDIDSDDEDGLGVIRRWEDHQRQVLITTPTQGQVNGASRNHDPLSQSTISSNDSIDGYDSFENTNNKKKRKVPTSGSLGNHHSSLSSEMANMGISPSRDGDPSQVAPDGGTGQQYGTGSSTGSNVSGTGISGAGRGRYGRSGRRDYSGRSPLGVSTNGSNAWQSGRFSGVRREHTPNGSLSGKAHDQASDQGIISAAIAEAASLPVSTGQGQENVSLLEQQFAKKATLSNSQFTFSCESDSTKGMVWPGQDPLQSSTYHPASLSNGGSSQPMQNQKGFSTQGTQTSPTMAGQSSQNGVPQASSTQQASQPKKPRRPPGKRYAMAARERRLQQEYNNYHHPPRDEDIWVCEFCEYESIFGSPPEALVRQYEIKDRREKKRLAEKRRLLEKAKMKGRKGKKGNKNAAKTANTATSAQQASGQAKYNQQPADPGLVQNHGTQSDEYFADDYDDDPISMPAPPPAPPTKIPQPIAQTHNQSVRSVHGNSATSGRDSGTNYAL